LLNLPDYQERAAIDNSPLALYRTQQLIERDKMEHLRPNSIHNPEHHFGPVLRRIDMNTEGTLAERRVHGELPNWPEYDVWQIATGALGDL